MKIWFQNRRTKWKKLDNISNAAAAEHKVTPPPKKEISSSGGGGGGGVSAGTTSGARRRKQGGKDGGRKWNGSSTTDLGTPTSQSESPSAPAPPSLDYLKVKMSKPLNMCISSSAALKCGDNWTTESSYSAASLDSSLEEDHSSRGSLHFPQDTNFSDRTTPISDYGGYGGGSKAPPSISPPTQLDNLHRFLSSPHPPHLPQNLSKIGCFESELKPALNNNNVHDKAAMCTSPPLPCLPPPPPPVQVGQCQDAPESKEETDNRLNVSSSNCVDDVVAAVHLNNLMNKANAENVIGMIIMSKSGEAGATPANQKCVESDTTPGDQLGKGVVSVVESDSVSSNSTLTQPHLQN